MPSSVESERPILDSSAQSSNRISVYSKTSSPSEHSQLSMAAADIEASEFKGYATSLERMHDKRLQDQRYVISKQKEGDMSKLALAGKVQKALERRYQNQDAVMKPKKIAEKA